jgi:hypothetical protein
MPPMEKLLILTRSQALLLERAINIAIQHSSSFDESEVSALTEIVNDQLIDKMYGWSVR